MIRCLSTSAVKPQRQCGSIICHLVCVCLLSNRTILVLESMNPECDGHSHLSV